MNRAGVDAFCNEHGIEARWPADGSLRMLSPRPAVFLHPRSGEKIWFNAAMMHDSYSWELRRVGQHAAAPVLAYFERRSDGRDPTLRRSHCLYADGTPIDPRDIEHIRRALWDHAVMFDWQLGDMLLIDNCRVAHGRMPFKGPRRILAALGAPVQASAVQRPAVWQPLGAASNAR